MKETSLDEIFDFLHRQAFFQEESVCETLSWLSKMHKRGWLYTAACGEKILAVAAAYRLRTWLPEYRYCLPDHEDGDILYIAFFSSLATDHAAALKLLREHLRENPGIRKIMYHKKRGLSGHGPLKEYSRERVLSAIFEKTETGGAGASKFVIYPPAMAAVS